MQDDLEKLVTDINKQTSESPNENFDGILNSYFSILEKLEYDAV